MGTWSRLGRCMKAPLRVLSRARDLYVRSLASCGGRTQRGAAMAYPAIGKTPGYGFSSSARTSSSDDDLRELIRAASLSSLSRARAGAGGASSSPPRAAPPVRKSQSVAFGRIDEDKPCIDFEDVGVVVGSSLRSFQRRSRSYAAGAKKMARLYM